MQSTSRRPLVAVEYFLRVAVWLFAVSTEFLCGTVLTWVNGYVNSYTVGIAVTIIWFAGIRRLGQFPIIRDLSDLYLYDILVQIYGLILHLTGTSISSYLVAAIAVYLLKFIRLVWWGKNIEGDLLSEWPKFGLIGCFSKKRIEENITRRHRNAVYGMIALAVLASYFIWLSFVQMPANFMFFAGIVGVVLFTNRAAVDIQRRDEERITSIRELERAKVIAELNADAAARNEDLRGAAHDLNNPVWAMTFTARDIGLCTDLESAKEIAQNMEAGLRDLNDLIVEVVEMARLGTKLKTSLDDVVYLPALCRHFSKELGALARERGVVLGFNDTTLAVKSNEWLLKRIINNLLMNAIVHGKNKTIVTLSIRSSSQFCYIRVWDTGPGIAGADGPDRAANFKNLLSNLHRTKDTDPEKEHRQVSGHGLGLRGVMRMSNTLGLQMSMVSRVGKGTMFRFKVPLATLDDLPPDF